VSPPEHIIQFAIEASLNSACQSKRGATIFRGFNHIASGWNHKPSPFKCDGSNECKMNCGKDAIHAEQHAILGALSAGYRQLDSSEMLHVKTENGVLVPSMGPSCLQCSKLILSVRLTGMWLYHHKGWSRYQPAEFHYLSGAYIPKKNNTPQAGGGASTSQVK
jgi:deoxycytidylate deaminase